MNRKQRRVARSQGSPKAVVHWRGGFYTLAEANALAIREANAQAAAEIYGLILMHAPDAAEIHSNRGFALHEMKKYSEALEGYDRAIKLKPDSAEIHNNRGITLQALGRYDEALASHDKAIKLRPGYADAYNNRGLTLQKMRRYSEALEACDTAIKFRPDSAELHNTRGIVLMNLERYEEALAAGDKAVSLKPGNAGLYNNESNILLHLKRYDESLTAAEKAIALAPGYAAAYQNRGSVLMDMGEMEEAERMFLRALALAPEDPAPLFNLAGLRRYEDADHADAKVIRAMLAKPGATAEDKEYLYFALGKIYDDCGWWDEAFECYRQANRIRSESVPYDAEATAATTRGIMEVFSRGFLAQKCEFGSDSKSPVFIVGMPRSGTTLMASILSSHPCVATAGELPTVRSLAAQLPELTGNGTLYPGAAKHITPAIAAHLSKTYEARLRRDASPDVPYVIDKHPLNFMHLGLIAMLFPGAHAIHCTRDPLDTGLSNYFQRFSRMYEYASDLTSIGHFYGEYAKLMEHWHNVLPVKMLEVSYEDMVADTEKTARKALDFLGLAWDARCLSPHTNPSPVETASNWQVRQPIYRQSIERWRHYEKHLAPLKDMLRPD